MNIVKMEKSPTQHHREVKKPGKQSKEKANPSTSLLQVARNTDKPTSSRFKVQAGKYQLNVSKFFKEQLSDMEIYTPEAPLRNRYRFVDKSKLPTEKIFMRIQRNLQLLNEKLDQLNLYESLEDDKKEEDELSSQKDALLDLKNKEKGEKAVERSRHGRNGRDCQFTFSGKASKLSSKKTAEE